MNDNNTEVYYDIIVEMEAYSSCRLTVDSYTKNTVEGLNWRGVG